MWVGMGNGNESGSAQEEWMIRGHWEHQQTRVRGQQQYDSDICEFSEHKIIVSSKVFVCVHSESQDARQYGFSLWLKSTYSVTPPSRSDICFTSSANEGLRWASRIQQFFIKEYLVIIMAKRFSKESYNIGAFKMCFWRRWTWSGSNGLYPLIKVILRCLGLLGF